MRITYCLWYLDVNVWRLIAEGEGYKALVKDVKRDIVFSHRGTDYITSIEPYWHNGHQDGTVRYIHYCVTQVKGL